MCPRPHKEVTSSYDSLVRRPQTLLPQVSCSATSPLHGLMVEVSCRATPFLHFGLKWQPEVFFPACMRMQAMCQMLPCAMCQVVALLPLFTASFT